MTVTHVVGVDPGLVHTGVVNILFHHDKHAVTVLDRLVLGPNAEDTKAAVVLAGAAPHIYIEKYQPRSHLNTDAQMMAAVQAMKQALPKATVVLNTGVKKVVRRPLMELLGVWSFSTTTHHQDLRSAARIALLGMLKSEPLNRLLADVVRDHLRGETWDVRR